MFYILTEKIGCVPYFFQLIESEERGARMFTPDPRPVKTKLQKDKKFKDRLQWIENNILKGQT
jgi:hypothetical protein